MIGILIFILLGKALIESFWGLCLIAYGYGCQFLARILYGLAKLIRAYERLKNSSSK